MILNLPFRKNYPKVLNYEGSNTRQSLHDKRIAIWLLLCCSTIFGMVVLGGVTRLTGSGLSMVEWEPIMGVLPPLSQVEWLKTFSLYQQFPQFQYANFDMSLAEFKNIFWYEYAHRLLGRAIGLLFFIPMCYFFIRGWVPKNIKLKLIAMFILGGLQGLLGWYMVQSGLVDDPRVSQYRLTSHLGLAFILFAFLFWVALDLLYPSQRTTLKSRPYTLAKLLAAFIFFTILSGGFVAGLRAGFFYNTFPLMNGKLIPDGLFDHLPVWINLFENGIMVQFNHRILAMTVLVSVLSLWWYCRKKIASKRGRLALNLLLAAVVLQVTLGISTLLLVVPVALGAAHQGGALVLFAAALFTAHALKPH